LGQGRPYEPDEGLVRFILAEVEGRLGNVAAGEMASPTPAEVQAMADRSPEGVEKELIQRALKLRGGGE
ncbi:MAG: hypothetical protein KJN92_01145, partial [Gemmatimonadetes bacterium]|nr:hypothetical protein [Gemmatimonadota bacterium]